MGTQRRIWPIKQEEQSINQAQQQEQEHSAIQNHNVTYPGSSRSSN